MARQDIRSILVHWFNCGNCGFVEKFQGIGEKVQFKFANGSIGFEGVFKGNGKGFEAFDGEIFSDHWRFAFINKLQFEGAVHVTIDGWLVGDDVILGGPLHSMEIPPRNERTTPRK